MIPITYKTTTYTMREADIITTKDDENNKFNRFSPPYVKSRDLKPSLLLVRRLDVGEK